MPSGQSKRGMQAGQRGGFPFDRAAQIRKGVRFAQSEFPGNGKFAVPAKTDAAARGGEITNYDSMGKLPEPKIAKNLRRGR